MDLDMFLINLLLFFVDIAIYGCILFLILSFINLIRYFVMHFLFKKENKGSDLDES